MPSTWTPSTFAGPVQPFGERRTIIGQRGRPVAPSPRAPRWISWISVERLVEGCGEAPVRVLVSVFYPDCDEQWPVAVPAHQRVELLLGDAREQRRVRDLVAVQVQDRQDGAVVARVEELVRVPARRQRARLRLAVADDARDEQVRVVERGPVRVGERVAELPAFVDRARRLGRDVARDPAGEGELAEEPAQPLLAAADVRVDLAVGALEIGVRYEPGAAVPRPGDVQHLERALPDRPVQVDVDEVQPGGRPEVAEQARLDVLGPERLAQERVLEQVDLTDGEVVRRPPVRVDQPHLVVGERRARRGSCRG